MIYDFPFNATPGSPAPKPAHLAPAPSLEELQRLARERLLEMAYDAERAGKAIDADYFRAEARSISARDEVDLRDWWARVQEEGKP